MSNCLWTFETVTTTGFEADVDTISGVSIASLGDGSGADAVPCPTVPGRTGNGRLLCSANHYNELSTGNVATILHTSGNPIILDFWWRPLIDYPGGLAGSVMLTADYDGFIGALGNGYISLNILSEATVGLYTFRFVLAGFYGVVTTVNFAGVPLTLRDWNQVVVNYDGANTITLTVNGNLVGTIGPTDLAMPTGDLGRLRFAKNQSIAGALYGVLDTVSLNIS